MAIDAVLMAGSGKPEASGEEPELFEKPYLRLGGKALVERATEALLNSSSIQRVYVVGNRNRLESVLGALSNRESDRLRLVEEGTNLIDSAYQGFFLNLLPDHGIRPPQAEHFDVEECSLYLQHQNPGREIPAVFLACDLPFLTAAAVDEFIRKVPEDAALALGLADHQELEAMLNVAGPHEALDCWRLGAVQLRCGPVRMNNLLWARPLVLDANLYRLVQTVYQHRRVLQAGGGVHSQNWWSVTRECLSYGKKAAGGFKLIRGLVNIAPMALCALLGRVLRTKFGMGWAAWPFLQFLSEADLGFAAGLLLGGRADLVVCSHPGPVLDIDVEESFRFLSADDEAAFRAIQKYLVEKPPLASPVQST